MAPISLTLARDGILYLADAGHSIRCVTANGAVTTLVAGKAGFADGSAKQARFCWPTAITVSSEGTLFVTDGYNHRIRKLTVQANK